MVRRLAQRVRPGWRTRFAPAPTGALHLGHAVNAVFVWGLARALDGRVLLRIEDHDGGRSRPEFERGILDDLDWLGLAPDIGATDEFRAGPHAQRQSDNDARYVRALSGLTSHVPSPTSQVPSLVYPCICSRRDIDGATLGAFGEETRYPGTCRERGVDPATTHALRVVIGDEAEQFDDIALGAQTQHPASQCGDVLIRDRQGWWTYQFAVVVDDADQQIHVVIRGDDLLASTGRQLALARLVGRALPPVFLHHALVRRDDGAKLSKSGRDTGLADLRNAGWSPSRVLGEAARLAGLQPDARPVGASDLATLFGA